MRKVWGRVGFCTWELPGEAAQVTDEEAIARVEAMLGKLELSRDALVRVRVTKPAPGRGATPAELRERMARDNRRNTGTAEWQALALPRSDAPASKITLTHFDVMCQRGPESE